MARRFTSDPESPSAAAPEKKLKEPELTPSSGESLEGRERELTDFVENAAVAMHWVGEDGTILWANAAELAFLGYLRDEYIGHNVGEFHADPLVIQDILKRLKCNEVLHAYPARLRCKDGSLKYVAIHSNVYREEGRFVHTRCITLDLGEQKRATELNQRLSAIVESSDDAIISKDLNGIIQSWNRGAERIFGYRPEEVIGKHISILATPERADEIPNILQKLMRGERVDHYETTRKTKDGRILTVSLSVSPIRDSSGTIIGASKIARDVSEQKKLSEVQQHLAAIVSSSDDAILSKDLNGIIRSWNQGAERLFGYTADEIIGKHISTLAAPDRLDEIPNILDRIARGERIDHYETKRKTKDGRILTVSLSISALRDNMGKVIGASKVVRDITERYRQEQALREANAALSRSNADLNQFAYSASHDLQEPLRMVSIYSELLKKEFGSKLGPSGDEYISYTIQGALRMEQLLKDLRTYTLASTAVQEPPGDIDANKSLDKALGNLEGAIRESGASVTRTAMPQVRIHEFQLEQVFQNLIANAIRYRREDPPMIRVAAARDGPDWRFSVQDNGIGIAPRYKEQVFELFKRLHSVAEYPGTGMGLAISQRIIERAGGRIWVESEPGRGSTFYFTIPFREDPAGNGREERGLHPSG